MPNYLQKTILLFFLVILPITMNAQTSESLTSHSVITLGGGCFWCTEAVFQRVEGVSSVVSGYMGGHVPNPSYQQVTTGETGHAEVIQITFNPEIVTLERLLEWFWVAHDPTTLNRQGADVGTQYRSVIFFRDDQQRAVAEASKQAAQQDSRRPIVTEITAAGAFYPADDYHQDYFNRNQMAPYCQVVIQPKLDKLGLTRQGF
jgi:peptide-methionine (S)-S-oxide reductase